MYIKTVTLTFPSIKFLKNPLGISKAIPCVQAVKYIFQLPLGMRKKFLGDEFPTTIIFF